MQGGVEVTNPQDINLKELEKDLIALGITKDSAPGVIEYIKKDYADKLNRIENEIDYWNLALSISVDKKELIQLKQIIRKEFTK